MPEAYIRGNTIKYLRVPDEVIDKVRDDSYNRAGKMGAAQQQLHRIPLGFGTYHQCVEGKCWYVTGVAG